MSEADAFEVFGSLAGLASLSRVDYVTGRPAVDRIARAGDQMRMLLNTSGYESISELEAVTRGGGDADNG